MAIIRLGGGVAAASGSVGGITFSRNRGGPYIRNRATPTNPNTPFQQVVRSLVSQLTSLWNDTLTAVQRQSWDDYAFNVPLPNSLGEPRNVGGLGMYVRSNVPRLQATLPRVDTGPSIFNLGDFTAPVVDELVVPASLDIDFTATDDWVGEDGAAMLLYGSRGRNATVNFFKGPYRNFPGILGNATTPPTTPFSGTWPFTVFLAQHAFLRAQVTRADGRLSSSFRDVVTVT